MFLLFVLIRTVHGVPPARPEVPGMVKKIGIRPRHDTNRVGTVKVMLVSLLEIRFSLTVPKFIRRTEN